THSVFLVFLLCDLPSTLLFIVPHPPLFFTLSLHDALPISQSCFNGRPPKCRVGNEVCGHAQRSQASALMHIKISCAHSKLTTPSVDRDVWGLQGRVCIVLQLLDIARRSSAGDVYTGDGCVLHCID